MPCRFCPKACATGLNPGYCAHHQHSEHKMKQGIVLFGHGSRNPEWAVPFQAIRQEIARQQPDAMVELGFLELMQPTLSDAIAKLAANGADEVVIVPVFISAGSHVREDLPRLAKEAMALQPQLKVRVAPSLGEAPEIIAAMAQYAIQASLPA
ncbi:MAG TPA: CbiX/SirB N-terminal domain-containing protein [Rhodocyclaceae bacterium]|nr:CbiX/SirB N-terminal domain-containing protein [Rhodocyclaceae bacterium]